MVKFALAKFLKDCDVFGHPISVYYKGEETYPSVLGGVLTVAVQILTLILVLISVKEIWLMEDPTITQYAKPITMQNRKEIGDVNFADYGQHGYVIAIAAQVQGTYNGRNYTTLPPEVGRLAAFETFFGGRVTNETEIPFSPCEEIIPEETLAKSGQEFKQGIASGTIQCIDPADVTVNFYSDQLGDGKQFFRFKFVACSAEAKPGITCYSDDEL